MENIVFEGGGIIGLSYIGAIQSLEHHDLKKDLRRFAGTSIGSIFALMTALNYSSEEMKNILESINLNEFKDTDNIFEDAKRLIKHRGWYKGNYIENFIQNIIEKKGFKSDLTFSEFYEKTKKELYVVSFNTNKQKSVVFEHENYPNVKIVDAVRASSSIPFLFASPVIEGDSYIDGFLINNYPIQIFERYSHLETIGFKLVVEEGFDFLTLGKKTLKFFFKKEGTEDLTEPQLKKTVFIETPKEALITSFNLSSQLKYKLIKEGRKSTGKHIFANGLAKRKVKKNKKEVRFYKKIAYKLKKYLLKKLKKF